MPLPDNRKIMDQAQAQRSAASGAIHDMQSVFELAAGDMAAVDALIRDSLDSEVVLIRQIAEYIIGSGGKRLRPMLVVLAAQACGYAAARTGARHHVTLAAVIEFIHTATLLHDDVVDESDLRRGKQSAHEVWGNAASVLVGDFLYSRAFQMMVRVDDMRVMDVLSNATNMIAEGEVEQLLNMHDPEVSEARYFSVIEKKTAKLFEAACQLGAVLAGRPDLEGPLATYGRELGAAFQVADDVLDYTSDAATMGKNAGDDLAEGKPTLPLILCRQLVGGGQHALIDDAIRNGDTAQLQHIVGLIRDSGALQATMDRAGARARAALAALDAITASPWKSAMLTLAHYSVDRQN
jgi:octaprenyl-diphosphate synthase